MCGSLLLEHKGSIPVLVEPIFVQVFILCKQSHDQIGHQTLDLYCNQTDYPEYSLPMDDPFFAGIGTSSPVSAIKTLERSEAKSVLEPTSFRNQAEKNEFYRNKAREQSKPKFSYTPNRDAPHRHNRKEERQKDPNAPRLPSMLNDVPSMKPLKINPNKPPQSKKLYGIVLPDVYEYAEPYD